jgi:diguanylate cyclase (GGDEF)-like protein
VLRRRAEGFFEAVVEALEDGVVVMGSDRHARFVNPAAMRILELGPDHPGADSVTWEEWLPLYDMDGVEVPDQLRPVARAFRTRVPFTRQIYAVGLLSGERRWLLVSGRLVTFDDGKAPDMLISFSDITEQHEAVRQLMHQANHDPLTGLPHRGYVLRRIAEALATTSSARLRAVLYIDIDDLKSTNDTLGHAAGDVLLTTAAARLRQAVRDGDVVGRHGGDEFVALIFGAATSGEIAMLVDRLRETLAEPVDIADTSVPIRASVGMVEVDEGDERSANEILRDADRAMYAAKRAGRRR